MHMDIINKKTTSWRLCYTTYFHISFLKHFSCPWLRSLLLKVTFLVMSVWMLTNKRAVFWNLDQLLVCRHDKWRILLTRDFFSHEYHMHPIITHGFYIFFPIFEDHFFIFKEVFSKKCSYIWLVIKSGL